MKKELFTELIASIKEGGEIIQGSKFPSRTFTFELPDDSLTDSKNLTPPPNTPLKTPPGCKP
jgi:hypothetical protein